MKRKNERSHEVAMAMEAYQLISEALELRMLMPSDVCKLFTHICKSSRKEALELRMLMPSNLCKPFTHIYKSSRKRNCNKMTSMEQRLLPLLLDLAIPTIFSDSNSNIVGGKIQNIKNRWENSMRVVQIHHAHSGSSSVHKP